jgi:BsuBI/PstI restriction endonuclease
MATKSDRINEALGVLGDLGMPRAQQNERYALCLLALIHLIPNKNWSQSSAPLMGITPMMDWVRDHYDKTYAPNTRETFRRQTMHQFVEAGIAPYNPDDPSRPVNSPRAVYQIEPTCLALLKSVGTKEYGLRLKGFKAAQSGLAEKYAKPREMEMVPVRIAAGREVVLSPGAHSELIRQIWEEFGPRFVPGGELVYAGDTGEKWGYFNEDLLKSQGVTVDNHGKMPDVIIFYQDRQWLILAEAVTSHGPVDGKRHRELEELFKASGAGLVLVSAFPDRRTFTKVRRGNLVGDRGVDC